MRVQYFAAASEGMTDAQRAALYALDAHMLKFVDASFQAGYGAGFALAMRLRLSLPRG